MVALIAACGKAPDAKSDAAKPAAPAPTASAAPAAPAPTPLVAAPLPATMTDDQKISYGIGLNLGLSIAHQHTELNIDPDSLRQGIVDGLAGANPRVPPSEIQLAFNQMERHAAEKAEADARAFFDKNRLRPGVTVTASGLQYEVIKHGTGLVKPKATSTVKVHYEGTLLDGSVFDSSIKRGTPAEFSVSAVIRGWTEALQLMTVGDKWRLFIPANLAYGTNGKGRIPPNSPLVFEVELLEIK